MKSTKVVYLILASADKEHQLDEMTQKQTWAKDNKYEIIWLRGAAETFFEDKSRNLFVEIEDSYENILEKTRLGIEWCIKNITFDFLVRGNVSTYFKTEEIEHYLSKQTTEQPFFGGYIDVFNVADYVQKIEYVNGGAIFMNLSSALEITSINSTDYRTRPDDVALSEYMQSRGAKLTWIPRGNISNTIVLKDRMYFRLKSSSFALMASKRMNHLDKVFSERKFPKRMRYKFAYYLDELTNFKRNFSNTKYLFLSIYSVLVNTLRFRKYE